MTKLEKVLSKYFVDTGRMKKVKVERDNINITFEEDDNGKQALILYMPSKDFVKEIISAKK